MKQLLIAILIISTMAAFVGVAALWQSQTREPSPQDEQVTVLKNQIAVENLRLQQEKEAQKTALLKAQLLADQQKAEQDARIQARPEVEESRALLVRFWYFLPILLTGCALLGTFVGLPLYQFLKKVPVKATADGIETVLPAKLAAQLSLETTLTMRQAAMARTMAFTEEVSQQRFTALMSGVSAFKGILPKTTIMQEAQPALPAAETKAEFAMPTMRELYEHLQPGDDLVLGYDVETGNAVTGTFEQLYSGGTFGESGSGKSAWLRALVTQPVLCYPASKFYIVDDHFTHKQSLTNTLPRIENFVFVDMAKPEKQLADFDREFQRRKRQGEEATDRPLVLVVDELKGIRKKAWFPKLVDLMEKIPTEGRKFGVYMLISTQDCRVKAGFDFRDTLTSLYAFKNKPKQLQTLLQDSEKVQQVKKITQKGIALFEPTEGEPAVVKVPFCAPADMMYFTQEYRVRQANGREICVSTDTENTTIDTAETHDGHGDAQLFRAALNMCQNEKKTLAATSGVSVSLLTKIEKGERSITDATRQKLQAVLTGTSQAASKVIPFPQK